MKKLFVAIILALFAQAAFAFTIATGPSDGTYIQIAQDIKKVAEKDGVELQPQTTGGSLENIELLAARKVDLAIVQLDALRFVSDVLKQYKGVELLDKIKVILNLYPEEIHVITNKKDIQTFYHLEGKRVSIGTERGGSAVSAGVLFSVYDINAT
ncbi:MAG TPA: TAXI family TRAP transporter solute-binding subunit, partial [Candidatus Binatia bacterium]|nr:TAXI family TRAP transporter solute-binding subunit [Candidatus Binatia bacterium]